MDEKTEEINENENKYLGKLVTVDVTECDPNILNDELGLVEIMEDGSIKAKVTVLKKEHHQFEPHGISVSFIIGESHFTIHTWPELCFARIEISTCGEKATPEKVINFMKRALGAKSYTAITTEWGDLKLIEELNRASIEQKE